MLAFNNLAVRSGSQLFVCCVCVVKLFTISREENLVITIM